MGQFKQILMKRVLTVIIFTMIIWKGYAASKAGVLLAENKIPHVNIHLEDFSSVPGQFAARQLAKYLKQISGATFEINPVHPAFDKAIGLQLDKNMAEESYSIQIKGGSVQLTSGSERALLYAVYDFLEQLGCRWIAPQFSFYNGYSEYVPNKSLLRFDGADLYRRPKLKYRKLCIEEGLSHTTSSLKLIIEWMPKLRYNTFMVPLDYGGTGRAKWDNWREVLTPELKKRGLLIEVGGHGYQNFLNPKMENGTLFKRHPDWFGTDADGKRSPREDLVFNTSNAQAVDYLIGNVRRYIQAHPEIDIFDFWPPDMAKWTVGRASEKLGSPLDRQASLVGQVSRAIKEIRPDLILEMIAYQPVLPPPGNVKLDPHILVDFCPINQNFERQIYDTASAGNAYYVAHLKEWRSKYSGDIGLYSYFRKYAWNSLPVVIPGYIQRDLQWYSQLPLQGISTYAEPADWFSYELNFYTLGKTAWDPALNIDSLVNDYILVRFGTGADIIKKTYKALERIVPRFCSVPYTRLKSTAQITGAISEIRKQRAAVGQLLSIEAKVADSGALKRLALMLEYVDFDLQIQALRAAKSSKEAILQKIEALLSFIKINKDAGVFLLKNTDAAVQMRRQYTKTY